MLGLAQAANSVTLNVARLQSSLGVLILRRVASAMRAVCGLGSLFPTHDATSGMDPLVSDVLLLWFLCGFLCVLLTTCPVCACVWLLYHLKTLVVYLAFLVCCGFACVLFAEAVLVCWFRMGVS